MEQEVWKDIKGYEGLYQISNLGRVKSFPRAGTKGGILKQFTNGHGYTTVSLFKDKLLKTYLVHRLVGNHFLENPDNLPQINHKDENRKNSCVTNLEWCTCKYNNNYGSKNTKLSKKVAQYDLNGNFIRIYDSINEVKTVLGKSVGNIGQCCQHKRKSAIGYKWEYVNK